MKNFCIALVAVYAVFFQGFCSTARTTYESAVKESTKLQIYGRNILRANLEAVTDGTISVETLGQLNPITGAFVDSVGKYRVALKEARALVNADGTLPKDTIGRVEAVFNTVVSAFDAMVRAFAIHNATTAKIQEYIDLVKLVIAATRSLFAEAQRIGVANDTA
jgi:hypothetical protein